MGSDNTHRYWKSLNILLIAIACWNAIAFLKAHQAAYGEDKTGRLNLTHTASQHVDFISDSVPSGKKITWLASRESYLVDLSLQRTVNLAIYPTTVDYSGVLLRGADVVMGSKKKDRHLQRMVQAKWMPPPRLIAERNGLVAWTITHSETNHEKLSIKEAMHAWGAWSVMLTVLITLLVKFTNFRNVAGIDILGSVLLLLLFGFLTWIAFSTKVANSAEAGIWIMRARILSHQGLSGFLEFISSSTGRYHAPTYPPLHAVCVAILAFINVGFHLDLGRVLAIFSLFLLGYALLRILDGHPLRWGLVLIIITLPMLLRCALWGLAETLMLALIALAFVYLISFLHTGLRNQHYKWLILMTLASLVKIEGTLLVLIFLGLYLVRVRKSAIAFSTVTAIIISVAWPLWVLSQDFEGDFSIGVVLNRGWNNSIQIIIDTVDYLASLPFKEDMSSRASGILLIVVVVVNVFKFKRFPEKWIIGGFLIYMTFFMLVFPLSKVHEREDIAAWHLPSLERVILSFQIFLLVIPLSRARSKMESNPSLEV